MLFRSGRDSIASFSTQNDYDFTAVTENLNANITASQFEVIPSGSTRRITAVLTINGREAVLVPADSNRESVLLSAHGYTAGDKVRISCQENPLYDGEFTVLAASANEFIFDTPNFSSPAPAGTGTNRGQVWHDGNQTA